MEVVVAVETIGDYDDATSGDLFGLLSPLRLRCATAKTNSKRKTTAS